MEYKDYKENVINKTADSKGFLFSAAVWWFHPERLPLRIDHIGNCADRVVKVPNWSENERVVQQLSGPYKICGPKVPIIEFDKNVFCGNLYITDIILQSNIQSIPAGAFSGCTHLQRITIPKNISYIGEGTFKDCDNLQDVYYAGSEEEWHRIEIIYKASKPKDPKQLGLFMEMEHFYIPGNESLLRADIHFNCEMDPEPASGLKIIMAGKDVTRVFRK